MAGVTFNRLFDPQSNQLPTPQSGNQTLKSFATNAGATLYTVPTGKVFFITYASIEGRGTGGSSVVVPTITANSQVIASMAYMRARQETSSGSFVSAIGWSPTYKTFPTPIQLDAGDTIVTSLAGLGIDQIYFLVTGWEESKL